MKNIPIACFALEVLMLRYRHKLGQYGPKQDHSIFSSILDSVYFVH